MTPIYRASAIKRDSGESVTYGPVAAPSALDRATMWFGCGDYRSVRVERSVDGGRTWVRL